MTNSPHPSPTSSGASPPRRVLLLLSQLPHDPSSGAARSMLVLAKLLAGSKSPGFEVRILATSGTESSAPPGLLTHLAKLGIRAEVDRRAAVGKGRPVVHFREPASPADSTGTVTSTILDLGPAALRDWDFVHGAQFNKLLIQELETFQPEVVFTFGGQPAEQQRRYLCRAAGASVVFCLKNLSYLHPLAFDHVDAVLTPSRFMTELYREKIGLESTPIPPPLDPAETTVDPAAREARWFTFVNPTPAKGVYFFVTLADELARKRPDIPLQVIEARGTKSHLLQAGFNGGIDLRKHPNLRVVPTRARPRDVYADARAMLVPSVWTEPYGRIAAEALHNGIPAIVSGRGGLAEAVAGREGGTPGGVVLGLPDSLTLESTMPVERSAVGAWAEEIVRMQDDAAYYRACCERARAAAVPVEEIAARYVEFFARVGPAAGPVVRKS